MLRVLLLNNRVPYPLTDGGAKASYGLMEGLTNQKVTVDAFFLNTQKHYFPSSKFKEVFPAIRHSILVDINTNINPFSALMALVKGESYNIKRFDAADAHLQLKEILNKNEYDIIHFENLFTVPYLATVKKYTSAKCVLRMHNVEHQIWEKLATETKPGLKRIYLSKLAAQIREYEEAKVSLFDALLPISSADAKWVSSFSNKKIVTLPMGLPFAKQPSSKPGKHFFHIGSMEWMPNVQACEFLVNKVWPQVVKEDPSCILHLAGKGMGTKYNHWANNSIHVHGEVASATDFMQQFNTMIIPLRSASGLRIKALEALSMAKPIVSTEVGMSGLITASNSHFLMANTSLQLKDAILKIANDNNLYEKLAQEGYTFVKQNYDEQHISNQLKTCYEELLEN